MAFGSTELGTLVVRLNADISRFEANMTRMESRMKSSMGNVTAIATRASGAIAAATAAVAVVGLKQFAEFESSFAGVRKTVDATEREYAQLQDTFRKMATQIPINVNQINQVAEAAGQLGIAKENIADFARVMIDLGNSTNLSADQAATELARFKNIMQMPEESFGRLGSTIVQLGNNFATTEAEIVAMAMRLAGAGKTVKMTEAQVIALATALSSVGVESEMGGTAVSRLMIEMSKASKTGSELLTTFSSVAGMTRSDFATAFDKDAVGALQSFLVGLNNVKESGGDAFTIIENLGLDGARLTDVMMRMSGASGLLAKSVNMANAEWETNTALTEEAEKRYKTFNSQFTVLKNQLNDVFITIGEKIAPKLMKLNEQFQKFRDQNNGFKDQIQKIAEWVEGFWIKSIKIAADSVWGWIQMIKLVGPAVKIASEKIKETTSNISVFIEKISFNLDKAFLDIEKLTKKLAISIFETAENLIRSVNGMFSGLVNGINLLIAIDNKFKPWQNLKPISEDILLSTDKFNESLSKTKGELDALNGRKLDNSSLNLAINQSEDASKNAQLAVDAFYKTLDSLDTTKPSEFIDRWVKSVEGISPSITLNDPTEGLGDRLFNSWDKKEPKTDEKFTGKTDAEEQKEKWEKYYNWLTQKEEEVSSARLAISMHMTGRMTDLIGEIAGKNSGAFKAMFAMHKAFSIAMATVNISKAITDGWASGTTIYEKLAAVGVIMAETANIVSTIRSVKMGDAASFLGGGMVADGPRVGGVDGMGGKWAVVHPSEKILDPKSGNRGFGGNVYVYNNAPVEVDTEIDESGNISVMINKIKQSIAGDIRNKTGDVWKSFRETTTLQPLGV